jgi:two-component system NtrC family response regulator
LYRLRSLTIELPPLRERLDDMRDLVLFHVDAICDRFGVGSKGFDPGFMAALKRYEWPGNVRELVNTLEQAITSAGDSPTLFPTICPKECASAWPALPWKKKPPQPGNCRRKQAQNCPLGRNT